MACSLRAPALCTLRRLWTRPCVGLYGHEAPAWPQRWHPVGKQARWLVATNVDKSRGLDISVASVWEAFEQLWTEQGKR